MFLRLPAASKFSSSSTTSSTSPGSEFEIRLIDENGQVSSTSGRVEVFHKGSWGTICDDGSEYPDQLSQIGDVLCRQLGNRNGGWISLCLSVSPILCLSLSVSV